MLDPQRLDPLAHPLGQHPRAFDPGVDEEGDELLASVARHEVGRPVERLVHGLGHAHEALVAGLVAVGVVEALEVVDVAEDEREGRLVAGAPAPLLAQRGVETPAVGDLGERVESGDALEVAVAVLQLAPGLGQLSVLPVHLLGLGQQLEVDGDEAVEVVAGALREDAQERHQRAGVGGQALPEDGLRDLQHERVVEGAQGRRALAPLDEGHLAEAVPGAAHRHLLAGLGDHDVAGEDHVHRVALFALVAQRLAGSEHALGTRGNDGLELGLRERGEQPRAAQEGELVGALHGSAQASARRSSAAVSLTRKPSLSVVTIPSLPQRLMMRMHVSIVVPVRSASS